MRSLTGKIKPQQTKKENKMSNYKYRVVTSTPPPTQSTTTATTTTSRYRSSVYQGRSDTGNVELVSPPTPSSYMPWQHTQSHNELGQTEGGDGGVYVYLGSERCYPCKVPHKTFNKMITFKNEVELV